MSKVLLITNIPAPYRVDLFYYMQTHQQTHEFFVIYTNRNEDIRQWVIDERKLPYRKGPVNFNHIRTEVI